MRKRQQAFAEALSRLLFQKPLAQLSRSERAELNFLRALKTDGADEEYPAQTKRGSSGLAQVRTLH
jgi:hypothetical protein